MHRYKKDDIEALLHSSEILHPAALSRLFLSKLLHKKGYIKSLGLT